MSQLKQIAEELDGTLAEMRTQNEESKTQLQELKKKSKPKKEKVKKETTEATTEATSEGQATIDVTETC
jgi:ElaB/YqjD/DUF883 family membrane-anchored ribosome-binding protein